LLIRRSNPGRDLARLADASIVVIGLGLSSGVFLISPYIWRAGLTPGERLVSIAYPLGDVLVLAVAARLAIGTSNRPATWWLLTGSIVPLLFGDAVLVSLQVSNDWGTWQHQQLLDLCWILFYVGLGTAALHPSMVSLSEPTPVTVRLSRGRLLLLASACLLPSAILAIQAGRGRESAPTVVALAAGSAALFLLALVRMRGLAGELATQQERELTGQRVLRVAELERTRLAAELHDGPVQRLTALLYNLEVARLHLEAGELGDADGLLSVLETDLSVDIESLWRLISTPAPGGARPSPSSWPSTRPSRRCPGAADRPASGHGRRGRRGGRHSGTSQRPPRSSSRPSSSLTSRQAWIRRGRMRKYR
jgi:signal transduction histidine kinase